MFFALFSAISLHGISASLAQDAPDVVTAAGARNGATPNIAWMGGGMWSQTAIAQSPDGLLLAAASHSGDDNIKLWRIADGSLSRTLGADLGGVNDIAYSPNGQFIASAAGVVFGYEDASVKIWREFRMGKSSINFPPVGR